MRKIAKTGLVLALLAGVTAIVATNTAKADLVGGSAQATATESSNLPKLLNKINPAPTPGALVLFGAGTLLVVTTQRKFAGR